MKQYKIFVVGGGDDGNFIKNGKHTKYFEEADIVVFRGGSDINPKLYSEIPNSHTNYWSDERDSLEIMFYKKAQEKGIVCVGNCRGGQLLTVLNGGKLIQDIDHPYKHECVTSEGERYIMNSIHHQMMYPYELPNTDYEVFSWTEQLSPQHINQFDQQYMFPKHALDEKGLFKEPEIIYYPKTKSIAIQGHFEMMSLNCDGNKIINKLIQKVLNNE